MSQPVAYDIIYVRQPRYGDNQHIQWPEISDPFRVEAGSDLVLLHPNGSEEVLVEAGDDGAVTDPFLSFDAQWVYYAFSPDVTDTNYQRGYLSALGCDIYKINLQTRQVVRLTNQEFTPNLGGGVWDESNHLNPAGGYNSLRFGIYNMGPCPLPGGKVVFTSTRNAFHSPKDRFRPVPQLFVMDDDGANVRFISPMVIMGALHPAILRDGRIMFSTHEGQGLRDNRLWGVWTIYPDGRNWAPLVSAFNSPQTFHFFTQLTDGELIIEDYYNQNTFGFGALYRMPLPDGNAPAFWSAFTASNGAPAIRKNVGFPYSFKFPFQPKGMYSITPFTNGDDQAAPTREEVDEDASNGSLRVGKFTQPSAGLNNDVLCVWSAGPANGLDRPTDLPAVDAGLYLIPQSNIIEFPDELVLIKNDPNYNECWPRPVLTYQQIHGVAEPAEIPWLPNDGSLHEELPAGTPYGLIGTSSFYKRESFPGVVPSWSNAFDGLDAFNTSENGQSSNWEYQGGDAGKYSNSDIWAVRILAMEPNTFRSYSAGNGGPTEGPKFDSHAGERLRILGEIPLRKFNNGQPVLDPENNPDTSFLAKIPADVPFTFQTLDRNGMNLNMSQTWHQVRPGEVRNDCGGCHAHSQQPLDFEDTAAAQPEYAVWDLVKNTPLLTRENPNADPQLDIVTTSVVNVEFHRDIRPILQAHCTPCHTQNNPTPPGNLVLDDYDDVWIPNSGTWPGDYFRLAVDRGAQFGHKSLVNGGVYRQSNASRYIRAFQSRRSLLVWKVFGQRLDGWSNEDHPTESVPGNAQTLPQGASANEADIDFTGTMMPPPGSWVAPLTMTQKMTIARWIDLGCPIDLAEGDAMDDQYGWMQDDLRPTLNVSKPLMNLNQDKLEEIRVGVADQYSGVNMQSLNITASFGVNGRPAGTNLADLAVKINEGVYIIRLDDPIETLPESTITATVFDNEGNKTVEKVRFRVDYVQSLGNKVLEYLLGKYTLTPQERTDSNVNGDADIDVADLVLMLGN